MAEVLGLGASIIGVATAGVSVASSLVHFTISYRNSAKKLEALASRVTLSATILTEVGNMIKENEQYFKKNEFDKKFGSVLNRCNADYETLREAVSKASLGRVTTEQGPVKGGNRGTGFDPKKMSAWKKLAWALGGDDAIQDLKKSLDESVSQVLMMQAAAQMIILQIIGHQRRGLTAVEEEQLSMLRQDIGLLLQSLRKAGLLSVISIDMHEPGEQKDTKSSSRGESAPEMGKTGADGVPRVPSSVQSKAPNVAFAEGAEGSLPAPPPAQIKVPEERPLRRRDSEIHESLGMNQSQNKQNSLHSERLEIEASTPLDIEGAFNEVWMLYPPPNIIKQRDIRVLGIKMRVTERNFMDQGYRFYEVVMSQKDIQDLITNQSQELEPISPKLPSTIKWLADKPDLLCEGVGALIGHRHETTKYWHPPRSWTLRLLLDVPRKQLSNHWRRLTMSPDSQPSYLAILTCQVIENTPNLIERSRHPIVMAIEDKHHKHRHPSDRRRNNEFEIVRERSRHRRTNHRGHNPTPLITAFTGSKTSRRKVPELFIAQENAESLVNNFLASFSTLYDEIPEKNRRDVLESVPLRRVVDDRELSSDDDGSSSSGYSSASDSFADD